MGPPYGKRDPYYSLIPLPCSNPQRYGKLVWVPLTIFGGPMSLGVPGITLDVMGSGCMIFLVKPQLLEVPGLDNGCLALPSS